MSVPRLCTFFLLLVCLLPMNFFLHARAQPCKCPGANRDELGQFSLIDSFDQMPGVLFLKDMNASSEWITDGLSSYMETHPELNLSSNGSFIPLYSFRVWKLNGDGPDVYEASFSILLTFGIHELEGNSLALAILPSSNSSYPEVYDLPGPSTSPDYTSRKVAGRSFSARIVIMDIGYTFNTILVQISIESLGLGNPSTDDRYTAQISYDHILQRMYVNLDQGEGIPNPDNTIAQKSFTLRATNVFPYARLGFFSSIGQFLQIHTLNMSFDALPDTNTEPSSQTKTIILSSVLGSTAVTAITAAVVYFYFTSKYRMWKKEQDKLAKVMQQLPGVPTQIDYVDIKKATKNFNDTKKLGKGGFGTVYKCTLPAATSRTGQAIEVAVKKFIRDVENLRYTDFLAEVSIINRLRHKNIVPLVGWSYNKGEPLLVYEYMTNGSLDQHLFSRGSNGKRKRHEEAATMRHWVTRYGIVRDIAIGLHYVHHEHEPMVLHRDIKASNIMLDSTFGARLGDFGIACTVAANKSSVTGFAGTIGYIAPDYAIGHKATRQSDIYAFGVLILEIVTGKKNGDVQSEDDHITEWVWRLHQEGKLLDCVDSGMVATYDRQQDVVDEAKRLLLLGLACTNPNPSNRPSMVEVVQVINKLAPMPKVPLERPTFVWPPEDWRTRNSVYSTAMSDWERSSATTIDLEQSAITRRQSSFGSKEAVNGDHEAVA